MALVKFGGGVAEMRGKQGGVIYSRNAAGAYIKTKVTPVNPQTSYQQAVRAMLQGISQSWKTLTEAQKDGWDTLGAQVTRINVFGDSLPYTGYALFMRLNLNLEQIEQATIVNAPTVPSIDTLVLGAISFDAGPDAMTVLFTPSQAAKATSIITYTTGNIVTGRRFVKNLRRLIQFDSESTGTLDIQSSWEDRFGALIVGARVFVALKLVDEASGFDGSLVVGSAIVAAAA